MNTDDNRLVLVLSTIHMYTDDAIVLHTWNEEHAPTGELTFTVPKSLAMLQTVAAYNVGAGLDLSIHTTEIGHPQHALTMTPAQQADAYTSDAVMLWLPLWKCRELGVTSSEPTLPEAVA